VVTATLRAETLAQAPGSITVLDTEALKQAGQQHFEDVLAQIPNLNFAGDTSRPRYFQIRGIGELAQYQGAPNPSVGFLIDDIDFSGLGSVATLFDVDHIEVLHGPQGTLYGANALAGLIYVKSAEPSETFGARLELDAGDFGERSYGAVITGPVSALDSSFRLAVQSYESDGFYHDAYLDRHDTDKVDELTLRGRWRFEPSNDWRVDLTVLRAQMNNGYDAFAIDNTRTTESDHPGVDRQFSTGLSLRSTYTGFKPLTWTTIATYADSTINYGFDGDWGNPILWAPYTYDFTEFQTRYRSTKSFETRLGNDGKSAFNWLIGLYAFELKERLTDFSQGTYADPFDDTQDYSLATLTESAFRSRSFALFGQIDGALSASARWSLGLRGERHLSRYDDLTTYIDDSQTTNHFNPSYDLWGGQFSLEYDLSSSQHVYALLSRGYKAGGFNLIAGLPADQLLFSPEWDLNVELGHKSSWNEGRVRLNTSVFYMARHHEQLLTGEQLDPSDPNSFIFFTGNSQSGFNYGLESSLQAQATEHLELGASLGLLQTRYHGFVQNGEVLPDRALPHAPPWQAAVNATFRASHGVYLRVDVTGMGSFLYDLPPNDTRSHAYALVNGRIGWQNEHFEVYLWGRNLLDKNYTVRGFYFGDEPPDFNNKLYTQLGEPRNGGVHFTMRY
jgi:outer membrane receptor protein involved in Fe transport